MRIDEHARRCVSFLFTREHDQDGKTLLRPAGTAFFVGEQLGNGRTITYVVTARHVVDGNRPNQSLWIRCTNDSRKVLYEFPVESWWQHDTADIAVAPLAFPLGEFDLLCLPITLLADRAWLEEHDVGIGDLLVNAGLFNHYIGQERDAPMMRFGRIALIPNEPIRVPSNGPLPSMEFSAFLAELGAWPGQSGSPVFIYFSIDRHLFAGERLQMQIPNPRLLGLIHGHFNFPGSVRSSDGVTAASADLNSGIAIVVPASGILDVLSQPQAVEYREQCVCILREEGLID